MRPVHRNWYPHWSEEETEDLGSVISSGSWAILTVDYVLGLCVMHELSGIHELLIPWIHQNLLLDLIC